MDQRQLLNFLAVCEEKSISKAAKRCFLTQQGLSSSMKLLEDELEVPLFNRKAQGIELTEFGAALQEAVVSYVHQHDQIIDRIRHIRDKSQSIVSIAYRSGLHDLLPRHFFLHFMKAHPETALKIRSFSGGDGGQKKMAEHNIHIGFASEPVDPVLFDSLIWHRGDIFLVVGKDHRLATKTSIKLKELQGEAIAVFQEDTYPQNIITKLCSRQGIIPSFYLEGFETSLFHELCSTNKVAALWEGSLDNFPGCVKIKLENISLEWDAYFIVQKNVYLSNAEKLFVEYTKKTLAIE